MKQIRAFNEAGQRNIEENKLSSTLMALLDKANAGTLTRADKEYITKTINECSGYGVGCIPVMGVLYDFNDVLKTYVYKQYNHWTEARAIDKTALRATVYGRIDKILEVK
jgi:hypothetical protein